MFNVGDYVFNQKTGHIGKVVGYGHQMLKSGYTSTLKVLVIEAKTSRRAGFMEEDLYSVWVQWSGMHHFQLLLKDRDSILNSL
jgi:hypothetical protein